MTEQHYTHKMNNEGLAPGWYEGRVLRTDGTSVYGYTGTDAAEVYADVSIVADTLNAEFVQLQARIAELESALREIYNRANVAADYSRFASEVCGICEDVLTDQNDNPNESESKE